MAIDKKIIDELLKDYETPEDVIGKKGILKQLTKSLLERELGVKSTIDLYHQRCYVWIMSRPLRIDYPNAWHHVMNRARRRENLFVEEIGTGK